MGAYPGGAGLTPVEGNGHFFCSCRQLYLSDQSFTEKKFNQLFLIQPTTNAK